jgi:PhoH-like ATPase
MIVLEELDGHKKGMTSMARNAFATDQPLDALAGNLRRHRDRCWTPATAKPVVACFFKTKPLIITASQLAPRQGRQPDPGVVEAPAQYAPPREVGACVPKDINMRVKARPQGWLTTTKVTKPDDGDLLYSGALHCRRTLTRQSKTVESRQQGSYTFTASRDPLWQLDDQPVRLL